MSAPTRLVLAAVLAAAACSTAPNGPHPEREPPSAPATPTAEGDAPPEVAAVVDAVVAAYGGPAAVAKLGACRVLGTIESRIRDPGGPGSVRRDFRGPDQLRVAIAYPGSTELRLVDGERAWRGTLFGVTPAQGPALEAIRYQLMRVQPAWVIAHFRDRLAVAPAPDGSGDSIVTRVASPAVTMRYRVRAADHRIVRVDAALSFGAMTLPFATDYSDFRQVDGAWVAFHEENHANGRHTGTTRLRSVELGVADLGPFEP